MLAQVRRDCIHGVIGNSAAASCPMCRQPLLANKLKPVGRDGKVEEGGVVELEAVDVNELELRNMEKAQRAEARMKSDTLMISKLSWLVLKLRQIKDVDATAKVLVFTQFASTLEWLQGELPKKGFQYRTLTGSMSMQARRKALQDFQNDPPTTVFLLSMRSGAVGINLTQANHVVVLEPCLNKALEDQAIGRVHRMGQRREVQVYRVACLGSVEERVLQLHEKKVAGTEKQRRPPCCWWCLPLLLLLLLRRRRRHLLFIVLLSSSSSPAAAPSPSSSSSSSSSSASAVTAPGNEGKMDEDEDEDE